jgi:hypothetical protein
MITNDNIQKMITEMITSKNALENYNNQKGKTENEKQN